MASVGRLVLKKKHDHHEVASWKEGALVTSKSVFIVTGFAGRSLIVALRNYKLYDDESSLSTTSTGYHSTPPRNKTIICPNKQAPYEDLPNK